MDLHQAKYQFETTGCEQHWLDDRSDKILLAVSGGSDSMGLMLLFSSFYGIGNIAVAHLNHGIRKTARRDQEFVSDACRNNGIAFYTDTRPVPKLKRSGESIEAAARRIRYGFLKDIKQQSGCRWIALGHTSDDLAESVLLNMCRGCGLWGLAGMPRVRDPYIRPLVHFRRTDLRDLLKAAGWGWVEDETNDSDLYMRNRIRHKILPLLNECINAQTSAHLVALSEEAVQWRSAEEEETAGIIEAIRVSSPWPWLAFDLQGLRSLGPQLMRFLRGCGREMKIGEPGRHRTEELANLIIRSGVWTFQWNSRIDVRAHHGVCLWGPAVEKWSDHLIVSPDRPVRWGGWQVSLTANDVDALPWDLLLPLDSREILLERSKSREGAFDGLLPDVIVDGRKFSANPQLKGWENSTPGVKYKQAVRLNFRPMEGRWGVNDEI